MKFSGVLWLTFTVLLVLSSWILIISDFETNYIDTGISDAPKVNETYMRTFGNASEINKSISPLEQKLKDLGEDKSWYEKLADSGVVIPLAIISFVGVSLEVMTSILANISTVIELIGVPTELVGIVMVALLTFIIILMVEFWRRYEV